MKVFFAVMVIAASAMALAQPAPTVSACGIKDSTFRVKLNRTKPTLTEPGPGKAMVYFIQDNGLWGNHQHYTLKIEMNGRWVGAYKKNSYFSVLLKPGEHHVCALVQSDGFEGSVLALAHFTSESGKVYYFRTRFLDGINGSEVPPYVDLNPLDSDEAKYLLQYFPLSISLVKK